jgi:formate hydrogenlyase subunit 4
MAHFLVGIVKTCIVYCATLVLLYLTFAIVNASFNVADFNKVHRFTTAIMSLIVAGWYVLYYTNNNKTH